MGLGDEQCVDDVRGSGEGHGSVGGQALGTGRPRSGNLPCVTSTSEALTFQARTGARPPQGPGTGHPTITGALGLLVGWKDRGTLIEGRTEPGLLRLACRTGAVPQV